MCLTVTILSDAFLANTSKFFLHNYGIISKHNLLTIEGLLQRF